MLKDLAQPANRKTHYIIIVADHPLTEQGSATLDAVRTGLVHGFAGGDIAVNFFFRQFPEMQIGNLGKGFPFAAPQNGTAGHDLMVPTGKQVQHGFCVCFISGLAQNLPTAYHNGVRGDDNIICFCRNCHGLQAADPANFIESRFFGVHGFINIRYPDHEGKAEFAQQFLSPGRGGS